MKRYGKETFRMFRYLSQEDHFVETEKVSVRPLTTNRNILKSNTIFLSLHQSFYFV